MVYLWVSFCHGDGLTIHDMLTITDPNGQRYALKIKYMFTTEDGKKYNLGSQKKWHKKGTYYFDYSTAIPAESTTGRATLKAIVTLKKAGKLIHKGTKAITIYIK